MSRIAKCFEDLKTKGEGAFMPFMTLGYPTLETCSKIVKKMVEGGADLIELGVPFSDPLADGPTIQESSQIALENGMNVKKSLELISNLRKDGVSVPLLFMGYANPFLAYGIEKLFADAAEAGVDGFIVPDLPPSEANQWLTEAKKYEIDMIFFISPTTSEKRIQSVLKNASGFIYCITVTGVTGARKELPEQLKTFLIELKDKTPLPLAVGFGLSNEQHVREVTEVADGAIMASALLKQLKNLKAEEQENFTKEFVSKMKEATKGK